MNIYFFIRTSVCCAFLGIFLFVYVNKKNTLTEIQLRIPVLTSKLRAVNEEVESLQFLVDRFEGPENLMNLALLPEYRHLRQPLENEIIYLSFDES